MDLLTLKEDFLSIFGTAYPAPYCRKHDSDAIYQAIYCTPKIKAFIQTPLSQLVGKPLPCTAKVIYTCRCVTRIFNIDWRLTKEGMEKCLVRCMTALQNKSKCSIQFDSEGKISKHICSSEIYFQRRMTDIKHNIGELQSKLVTAHRKMAIQFNSCPSELRNLVVREVEPDVNYCVRAALMDYMLNCACVLKVPDLLDLLHYFAEVCDKSPTDVDLMHVLISLNTVARSAFKNAVLELNPPGCLCHVKCNGIYGIGLEILDKAYYHQLIPLYASTQICPVSRLSLNIRNTTAVKPKKCVSSNLPASASCSHDGASSIKHLKLYLLGEILTKEMKIEYSHRAYVTNTMTFTKNKNSSSNARTLNLCIGGLRTCHRMVVDSVDAYKQRSDDTPFWELCHWWACRYCKENSPSKSNYYNWLHKGSCYEKAYVEFMSNSEVPTLARKVCRGCKVALCCRHSVGELLSKQTYNKTLLRKVNFLLQMRHEIKSFTS